ncbi:flavonoid [Musa troglodytarum]|uniref:Flavonoid n=1 Tax=Musa troglodytarum TaxID=320322 RepID=A0A9E7GPM3_9LILI|nr:flavonoid [Musa troglodytarum]
MHPEHTLNCSEVHNRHWRVFRCSMLLHESVEKPVSIYLEWTWSRDKGRAESRTASMRKRLALRLSMVIGNYGANTSSSTVEWALAELTRHPDVLKRAQLERDSVVRDPASLPLMQAVVKETFRLHPPTPLSLPLMASEACEVSGYSVPKGATLLVNIWAITHDPASWPEPLEFRPARFLPGGRHESIDVKGKDFEIIPFGAGRRVCSGMSLGMRMVQPMAATLAHGFDWRLPAGMRPENLDMEEAYGLKLQRAAPLMAYPVPRLVPAAYEGRC